MHNKSELALLLQPCMHYYSASSMEDATRCLATQGQHQKFNRLAGPGARAGFIPVFVPGKVYLRNSAVLHHREIRKGITFKSYTSTLEEYIYIIWADKNFIKSTG